MYNLTFNNFDSLSHSRVYFAACLTIVFNFETFAESGSKSLQESFASVWRVADGASGASICRTVAGSGLTRVESRSRWNIPGKCNRLSGRINGWCKTIAIHHGGIRGGVCLFR